MISNSANHGVTKKAGINEFHLRIQGVTTDYAVAIITLTDKVAFFSTKIVELNFFNSTILPRTKYIKLQTTLKNCSLSLIWFHWYAHPNPHPPWAVNLDWHLEYESLKLTKKMQCPTTTLFPVSV